MAEHSEQGVSTTVAPDVCRETWSARRITIAFVLLIGVTLAARLWHPVGWLGSDDAAYHAAAEHVLLGEPIQRVHHHYARSPVVLATAASMWAFGENTAAAILPSLVTSLISIVLVVMIGRMLWGWWEGVMAGTVLSFIPILQNSSTCLLPTPHTCMWAALAIVMALVIPRSTRNWSRLLLAVGSGFAAGIATSSKVFAGMALIASVAFIWSRSHSHKALPVFATGSKRSSGYNESIEIAQARACGSEYGNAARRSTASPVQAATLSCAILGGFAAFFLAEAAFFAHAAGDPLFKLHAMRATNGNPTVAASHVINSAATLFSILTSRLTMPFRTAESTWGFVGMAFWPAVVGVMLFARRGRVIAGWALATYFAAAFAPLGLERGWRVFPWFDGRNISVICVPFALCMGWTIRCVVMRLASVRYATIVSIVALVVVVGLGEISRRRLDDAMSFEPRQVGNAITELLKQKDWQQSELLGERHIHVAPSVYWRYRILFPEQLRARLRVVADPSAPTWWRLTTADIAKRWVQAPLPADGLLLVTPLQLRGETHNWEYGVRLPGSDIRAWSRRAEVIASAGGFEPSAQVATSASVLLLGIVDHSHLVVDGRSPNPQRQ